MNQIVNGLLPVTSASLQTTISTGAAFVGGVHVSVSVTQHTFTASKDTYIDLSVTGYTYVEVENNAAVPALTASGIRVAKVVTSTTAVTTVSFYGYNTVFGYGAGGVPRAIPPLYVTAIGHEALASLAPTGISDEALYNMAIGFRTGQKTTTGHHNTFAGFQAGMNNTIGYANTFIGEDAGYSNTGSSKSVIIGAHTGQNSTGGQEAIIGASALQSLTSGNNNVAFGANAGQNVYGVGINLTTLSNSTLLGFQAGTSANALTNIISIGFQALADEFNSARNGNP